MYRFLKKHEQRGEIENEYPTGLGFVCLVLFV